MSLRKMDDVQFQTTFYDSHSKKHFMATLSINVSLLMDEMLQRARRSVDGHKAKAAYGSAILEVTRYKIPAYNGEEPGDDQL